MEKENVKTSQNHIMRDVMVGENVMLESAKEDFLTIIVCVTMSQRSATLCKPTGSTFSPCNVSRNNRGASRSSLSRTPKGKPRNAA
eukprot:9684783-Ditylum_brightwellii.AAC.1